jgi:hypothetical protein
MRILLIGMSVGLLIAAHGGAAVAAADTAAKRTDELAAIDRWVSDRMAARDLPGVAVAVVRGGEVVHWPATASPTTPVVWSRPTRRSSSARRASRSRPWSSASSSEKDCCRGTSRSGRIWPTSSIPPRTGWGTDHPVQAAVAVVAINGVLNFANPLFGVAAVLLGCRSPSPPSASFS